MTVTLPPSSINAILSLSGILPGTMQGSFTAWQIGPARDAGQPSGRGGIPWF
jgi:hypothetical protein